MSLSDLATSFVTPAVAAQVYDRTVQRIDDMSGGVFREIVFIKLTDIGEQVANITFASTFVEKPAFTSGWELGPSQQLLSGQFPTVNVGVRAFQFTQRSTGDRVYTGASLIILATGTPKQTAIVHASFEGQGLWSPV